MTLPAIHSTTILVKLNRGDKVSLLGQEEGDYLKIAPPEIATFAISYPTTPVVAGQPAAVVISAVDKDGHVITDPIRTTPSTLCFTVDVPTIVEKDGFFDTLYAGQNNCMSNPFTDGEFRADFLTFISGDNQIDISITYGSGQTFNGSFTLDIVPDVPDSIVIVKRGDPDSTPVLIDTLSSFGTSDQTSQWYVALLFDKYGNLITSQTITSRVGWSVVDLPANLNIVGNEAMYNAANLTSGGLGTLTITYNYNGVTISNTFQIAVIPLVGVAMVSTHEWVPDTVSGVSEIQDVLTNVFGVNVSAIPAQYPAYSYNGALVKKLESFGFMPYCDGYLDYLNIVMSDTFTLLDKHIAGVNFRFNSSTGIPDTIYWADSLINTTTQATTQRMKLQALSLDKRHYRLWLVPNSHRNSLLETGFKPAVVFNNGNVTHTMVRIGNGATFARTVQDSTRDSAAPVIHRFLYKNNICNTAVTTNEVKIAFSEPIDWSQAPDVHSIYSFTLINGATKDSTFMHSTSVTISGANAIEALDDKLAWNYNKNETNKLMTYRIEVAQSADQKFQIGGTRLRFSVNPLDHKFKDLSGNLATLKDNRQVSLEAEGVQQTVCGLNGPTSVSRYDAMVYNWSTDPATHEPIPNFPFFGFTVNLRTITNNSTDFILITPGGITNSNATNGYFYGYSLDTNKVLVTASATIYDVFGNSVASPSSNKNLRRHFKVGDLVSATNYANLGTLDSATIDSMYIWLRAVEPGAPDTLRPKLNSTVTIGYDYIMQHCNPNTSDEICIPAWNCLNAKGRLVAPGGYIATVSIASPGNETTEIRKLIVTSGAQEVGVGF